jgi:hypothetical protein
MEKRVAGELAEVWLPLIGAKGRGGDRSVEELDGRWQWAFVASVMEGESDGMMS